MFLDCHIDLSLKPLIPRPETEYWISQVIKKINRESPDPGIRTLPDSSRILDLCCGSGCIGIALLKHLKNISVYFGDIDKKALKQTEINLKFLYRVLPLRGSTRLDLNRDPPAFDAGGSRILRSNLFDDLKSKKYDYIFCNPPYVNPNGKFDPSLKFEPINSLFAKDGGLYFIKKILKEYKNHLQPNGKLFLEFGFGQKTKIEKYLKQLGIRGCKFNKDQFNRYRYLESN